MPFGSSGYVPPWTRANRGFMNVIASKLRTSSDEYRANSAALRALVDELRDRTATVALGGSESARQKHTSRGKLLVRDRIDLLLDPGTAFLEFSPLAAFGMYGGEVASSGAVAGVGRVNGRECVIVGNDATVK